MITDEMVKAALKAEEEYHASNDISYTSEGMRRALSAALAAMPQEPVAQLGGAPDDLHNLMKVVFSDMPIEQINVVCGEVLKRRDPSLASPAQGATAPAVKTDSHSTPREVE